MSKNKTEQNAEKAKAFFAKNKNVNRVYFTSDGQMFRAEHYANNWAASLKDREVDVLHRVVSNVLNKVVDELDSDDAGDASDLTATGKDHSADAGDGSTDEKEALVKEHIELFDTKPAPNIGLETLKAKISTKKAELEAEKNVGTGDDSKNNPELPEAGTQEGDQKESSNVEK